MYDYRDRAWVQSAELAYNASFPSSGAVKDPVVGWLRNEAQQIGRANPLIVGLRKLSPTYRKAFFEPSREYLQRVSAWGCGSRKLRFPRDRKATGNASERNSHRRSACPGKQSFLRRQPSGAWPPDRTECSENQARTCKEGLLTMSLFVAGSHLNFPDQDELE